MNRFSANLGFLWKDRPLVEAIRAAKAAGFDAVECHWPYDSDPEEILAVLDETGLPMLGLNTRCGDLRAGDFGLTALPGREKEARAAIDEAVAYAAKLRAGYVHVMAGNAKGEQAKRAFLENLSYACTMANRHELTILIEPLNRIDAPEYFLRTTTQAESIIDEIAHPGLKLLFDCYHVQLTEGDLTGRLKKMFPLIGHIQFASVPDRGPPGQGEINFEHLFALVGTLGFGGPLGAEYKPAGATDATLDWLTKYR